MSVRCQAGPLGAAVVGQVLLAMAARAALPPLAADRVRADVAAAVASCPGPVELSAGVGEDGLLVVLRADPGAIPAMARLLEGHAPQADGDRLELRLRRTQLRLV